MEANALTGADSIDLPAGIYMLTIGGASEDAAATGDLDIAGDRQVAGAGEGTTIIDGGGLHRVIHVLSGTVELSGLTVRNGATTGFGGGIFSFGALTLTDVTISGNAAAGGGGIFNDLGATATLAGVAVSGNSTSASGGGIFNRKATLTLTNSAVSLNTIAGGWWGGGVYNFGGAVELTSSVVDGNFAGGAGGGIFNTGRFPTWTTLTLTDSTVSGNTGGGVGGGIYNDFGGTAWLTNVTVSGNHVIGGGGGGGIAINASQVNLTDVTMSGNTANGVGGGINNHLGVLTVTGGGIYNDGTAALTNSTVSGNVASGVGGGIYNESGATASFVNVTVNSNTAGSGGGGLSNAGAAGAVTLQNSIVANSVAGGDCAGLVATSLGHNLDSDGSCGLTGAGDLISTDPLLGPLADNGGPTLTHALLFRQPCHRRRPHRRLRGQHRPARRAAAAGHGLRHRRLRGRAAYRRRPQAGRARTALHACRRVRGDRGSGGGDREEPRFRTLARRLAPGPETRKIRSSSMRARPSKS